MGLLAVDRLANEGEPVEQLVVYIMVEITVNVKEVSTVPSWTDGTLVPKHTDVSRMICGEVQASRVKPF